MFGTSKYKLYSSQGYEFLKIQHGTDKDEAHAETLVFVHGMFGGLSNFDPLISYLNRYSIYVPKIPLYDLKKSHLTIPKLAEWLYGFVSAMQIEDAIVLGNSMGGHVALEVAHEYPSKVKALLLTGSSGLLEYNFGTTFPKIKSRDYVKEHANMTFYEDLADDVIVDEILEALNSRNKASSLMKITRSTHAFNMENKLPEIKQPTLLVWGKQDVITPPKVAGQFHSLLPNSRLEFIDRCGHAPMMERPEQFASLMDDFLSKIGQSNRSKQQIS